jgi:hypothetical protein
MPVCLCISISIYISIYVSIYLHTYLSAYLCTCLSVRLSVYPCVHPSSHPAIHPRSHTSIFSPPYRFSAAGAFIPLPCIHIVPSSSYPYLMMSLYTAPPSALPRTSLKYSVKTSWKLLSATVASDGLYE